MNALFTLAASKQGCVYLLTRELNKVGLLSIIAYVVLAIGIPFIATLYTVIFTQDGVDDNTKDENARKAFTAGGIAAVAGFITLFMDSGAFNFALLVMAVSIVGLSRQFGASWGKAFGALGGCILAALIMEQIALSIFS